MFKLNPVEVHNKPIYKLLHNGYRFACVNKLGLIIKVARYRYELDLYKKSNWGSKIVEIQSLLWDVEQ